jgi:aromatic ring-opening dioxygenase LigB subunit
VIDFAAIAPHGDVDLAPELRDAMTELGRRCTADVAIVVTPHNVHVEGHFAVVTAARVGEHETDRELAHAIIDALRADGLPVVGVSYGGNDPAEAELPLDWGTEVRSGSSGRRGSSSSHLRATGRSTSMCGQVPPWRRHPAARGSR